MQSFDIVARIHDLAPELSVYSFKRTPSSIRVEFRKEIAGKQAVVIIQIADIENDPAFYLAFSARSEFKIFENALTAPRV